jgi:hypothetical protein
VFRETRELPTNLGWTAAVSAALDISMTPALG